MHSLNELLEEYDEYEAESVGPTPTDSVLEYSRLGACCRSDFVAKEFAVANSEGFMAVGLHSIFTAQAIMNLRQPHLKFITHSAMWALCCVPEQTAQFSIERGYLEVVNDDTSKSLMLVMYYLQSYKKKKRVRVIQQPAFEWNDIHDCLGNPLGTMG